jgi:FkbM family methyltransferase
LNKKGQYSLFAAKMGRRVISVEPFHDNILRLHKAAKLENLTDNIMLFTNAISNKPNEIKKLTRNQNNIGGQSLWPLKDLAINRSMNTSQDKYLVETIRLDDLVKYLPVGINNASTNIRQKAIMKIDIEGFEPYAFQKASKLFDAVDICVMFMEWGHKAQETSTNVALIDEMVTFLKQHGLKPYDDAGLLTRSWSSWSWDIVWRKDGY